MSISPILPGRLPNSLAGALLLQNIQHANAVLARLQHQIATNQKFFLPSEAPAAAIRSIALQGTIERKTQMQANIATARSLLANSENRLNVVSDALSQAKSFALSGVGQTLTSAEKQAMALEVNELLKGVVNAANSKYQGRYLFGGSQSQVQPFELQPDGSVRYNGDDQQMSTLVDFDLLLANNVDGKSAFGAVSPPLTADVDPALTLQTKVADLLGGQGVKLGLVTVSLANGGPAQTATVDLSQAQTVADIKTLLENAFSGGPLTLTVDVDPASLSGLRLTPSAGTVTAADVPGSQVATQLGIAGGPAAQILGGDLDPTITLQTNLADLNGGAGIGATAGNGLHIVNGAKSAVVNIDGAQTVEDLFNILRTANLDLELGINSAGNGIAISSRLSGADFSIGENNGTNAAALGIRTFTGSTRLADLHHGRGVPVDEGFKLVITRRDGTTVDVDLAGTQTVQQILDAINAVDPGDLVASLNTVGNGISLVDNSGAGPLVVVDNGLSVALGLNGQEPGANPLVPLVGREINPQEPKGVLTILSRLQRALENEDDTELNHIGALI
jgi:flagellar hook-associated protein 3 FlgL